MYLSTTDIESKHVSGLKTNNNVTHKLVLTNFKLYESTIL